MTMNTVQTLVILVVAAVIAGVIARRSSWAQPHITAVRKRVASARTANDGRPLLARLTMPGGSVPGKAAPAKKATPINPAAGKRKPADGRQAWKPAKPVERRASTEPQRPAGKEESPRPVPQTPWPGPPNAAAPPRRPAVTIPDLVATRRTVPAPVTGGPAMTTTDPGTAASADLFASVATLTGHARAGGLRSQMRAAITLQEGFGVQAAHMEAHARHLQESGLYTADVWEPWDLAAAALRVAAARLAESAAALTSIARTPGGEMLGRAPHHRELNTA